LNGKILAHPLVDARRLAPGPRSGAGSAALRISFGNAVVEPLDQNASLVFAFELEALT
jgi:hypothetical protein